MGDKGGGEEGSQGLTADSLAAAIAADCFESGREVGLVKVLRVTGGVFMVEIREHGSHTPETFFFSEERPPPSGVPE